MVYIYFRSSISETHIRTTSNYSEYRGKKINDQSRLEIDFQKGMKILVYVLGGCSAL